MVGSQRHTSAAIPWEHGTRFVEGWVGLKAYQDEWGKSRHPPSGIQSPDRPARSESLLRLGYPCPKCLNKLRNRYVPEETKYDFKSYQISVDLY